MKLHYSSATPGQAERSPTSLKCKKIITNNKKMSSSNNNRVYNNFPVNFQDMQQRASPAWRQIAQFLEAQRDTSPEQFRYWIESGNAELVSDYDNRGFEHMNANSWIKWPRSRQQLRDILRWLQGSNSNSNNNSNSNSNNNSNPNNNSRIKWDKKFVKNMPTNEAGSLNNFKNGNKVIQYKVGQYNKYISPYTFQKLSKMSPTSAYNKPKTQIMFKNPFTRANVKREEIKFMVLKDAATTIQSAVRGKIARKK